MFVHMEVCSLCCALVEKKSNMHLFSIRHYTIWGRSKPGGRIAPPPPYVDPKTHK